MSYLRVGSFRCPFLDKFPKSSESLVDRDASDLQIWRCLVDFFLSVAMMPLDSI